MEKVTQLDKALNILRKCGYITSGMLRREYPEILYPMTLITKLRLDNRIEKTKVKLNGLTKYTLVIK